jgi:hypothetical protein
MPTGKYTHRKNENSPVWKGDDVQYKQLHTWIRKMLGEPDKCYRCFTSAAKIDYANISGKYLRDIDDYIPLCSSCHKIYDGECGEKIHTSKLSEEDVWHILALYDSGLTLKEIGLRYNVYNSTVNRIILGKTWRYLNWRYKI